MKRAPSGYVIYDGPSALDGAPIVVIVTALKTSRNSKTGNMIQTYIIRKDMNPFEAVKTGADASICGDCTHRGDGTGKDRSCYVTLIHGPSVVYRSYLRGVYPVMDPWAVARLVSGRMVRLGTYGDPTAAPISVWHALTAHAAGWTGYTHQWRNVDGDWARLVMASADSATDRFVARSMGYRVFRVGATPMASEVVCPASVEAGKKTQCEACRACMGTSAKARADIVIAPHGAGKKHAAAREAAVEVTAAA